MEGLPVLTLREAGGTGRAGQWLPLVPDVRPQQMVLHFQAHQGTSAIARAASPALGGQLLRRFHKSSGDPKALIPTCWVHIPPS